MPSAGGDDRIRTAGGARAGRRPAARAGPRTDQDQGQGRRHQPDRSDPARRLPQGHPATPDAVLGFEAAGIVDAVGPGALEETIALLADGRLRLRAHTSMPVQQAAEAHRQLESGTVHERILLSLPSAETMA